MNTLFLISGNSGAGKTSIMRAVMDNEIVSFTTREKRPEEVHGIDYIFISKEEHRYLFENGGLLETAPYKGNHYGISNDEFYGKLEKGPAFAVVNLEGMQQLKHLYPKCVSILLYSSSLEDAQKQLRDRKESEEFIKNRLTTYEDEVNNKIHYDYVIKNKYGHMEETKELIKKIIEIETKE